MGRKQPLYIIVLTCMVTLELSLASLVQFTPNFVCKAVGAPYAKFMYTPINPYVNHIVYLDASTSKPNGGYIINYEWDFGDGTNGTGMYTTKIYIEPGNYTVTLNVTDSEGEKDTAWKLVNVLPDPDGVSIDLYNQKGGEGLNEPDGNFTLGEMVILSALLLYNNVPVQNKLVGFAVLDPTGEVVLDRSNLTDKNGLATINFTIPALCLPNVFGTWIAVSTASVSEIIVSDTLTFQVKGPYIDVYTQKEPYSGRGPRAPSDAFAPQEEVILYAYVSYSCEPEQNKPVVFIIFNPKGEIIVERTAFTNSVGIANTTFRIPWPCEDPEETIFGTWKVLARISILNQTAEDTLTFQVGWIIEVVEVETVNATGMAKNIFTRGEQIYFNLTVKNIAFVSKTATFTIVIYDERSVPIGHATLHSWVIQSGSSQFFIVDSRIPKWAYLGIASVYANAYTNLPQLCGVPYCPEITSTFLIQP